MWTPTLAPPPGSGSQLSASSRSRAVGGSMDTMHRSRRSRRPTKSRGVTAQVPGSGGRQAMAAALKELSVTPPSSYSNSSARVSVSMSPAWPRHSMSAPCGSRAPAAHCVRRPANRRVPTAAQTSSAGWPGGAEAALGERAPRGGVACACSACCCWRRASLSASRA